MKRTLSLRIGFLLVAVLVTVTMRSQYAQLEAFVKNIETFNRIFPQEKVYLHLDNTGYFIGETLWYKAYLTTPTPTANGEASKVLYVELVDPFGEVVETQKLHLTDGQAAGQFSLNRLRTSGFYEVRAYTRYMTNFDARGVFSRVLPVFDRPSTTGNYAQRHINEDFVASRNTLPEQTATSPHSTATTPPTTTPPAVHFYPEGGWLVKGLPSVVAFDVWQSDTAVGNVPAILLSSQGDTLATTTTLAEGRGSMLYTPQSTPAHLSVKVGATWHRFPLPEAQESGAVLCVGATGAQRITLQVTASEALQGEVFGLSLLHNGTLEAFDTLRLSPEPYVQSYQRHRLPAGVHQLTLFDQNGRIWAERLFFVAPDTASDIARISVATTPATPTPYAPLSLRLKGTPMCRFSLSVCDVGTTTNGYEGNVATYLLLSSDLKGFVRHAESYLTNDAPTRHRADLLMLTQAWRRYNWRMMAGKAPFAKQQPREDTLYIDGRLRPRELWGAGLLASKKQKERAKDVSGIDLRLTLYNREGTHFEGFATTDTAGYYAFATPPITGDWTLIFSTRLDNKLVGYPVTLNRWFSPERRNYDPFETELLPIRPLAVSSAPHLVQEDSATPPHTDDAKALGTAIIKRKRIFDVSREAWEVTRRRANDRSQYYFDMTREADRYLDEGRPLPTLAGWLMSKDAFARAFYGERRAMGIVIGEHTKADYLIASKTAQQRYLTTQNFDGNFMQDTVQVNNNIANHFRTTTTSSELKPAKGLSTNDTNNPPAGQSADPSLRYPEFDIYLGTPIDQVREVFVSLQSGENTYFTSETPSLYKDANPFHVFAYPRYRFNVPTKGFRQTTFKGFNEPETFVCPDYATLPKGDDHRRTLYWNPNVTLDENGTATLLFYNNGTAQQLFISAEGITPDGTPIIGTE